MVMCLVEQVVGHGNEEQRLKGQIDRLRKRELRLQQQVGISSTSSTPSHHLALSIYSNSNAVCMHALAARRLEVAIV